MKVNAPMLIGSTVKLWNRYCTVNETEMCYINCTPKAQQMESTSAGHLQVWLRTKKNKGDSFYSYIGFPLKILIVYDELPILISTSMKQFIQCSEVKRKH